MLYDNNDESERYTIIISDPLKPHLALQITEAMLNTNQAIEVNDENTGKIIKIAIVDNSLHIQSDCKMHIEIKGKADLQNIYLHTPNSKIYLNADINIANVAVTHAGTLTITNKFICANSFIKSKNMILTSGDHVLNNSVLDIEKFFATENNSHVQLQNSQLQAQKVMIDGKTEITQTTVIAKELDIANEATLTSSVCKVAGNILQTKTSKVSYANCAIEADRLSSYGPSNFNSTTLNANVYRQNGETTYHNSTIKSKECIDINDITDSTNTVFITDGNIIASKDASFSKGVIAARNYNHSIGCLYAKDINFKIINNFISDPKSFFIYNEGLFEAEEMSILGKLQLKGNDLNTKNNNIFSKAFIAETSWDNACKMSISSGAKLNATDYSAVTSKDLEHQGEISLLKNSSLTCQNIKAAPTSIIKLSKGSSLLSSSILAGGVIKSYSGKIAAKHLNLSGLLELRFTLSAIGKLDIGYSGNAKIISGSYFGDTIKSSGHFHIDPNVKLALKEKIDLQLLSTSNIVKSDVYAPTFISAGDLNTDNASIIADKKFSLLGTLNATNTKIDTDYFLIYPGAYCNAATLKVNSFLTFFAHSSRLSITDADFKSWFHINLASFTATYNQRIVSILPLDFSIIIPNIPTRSELFTQDKAVMLGLAGASIVAAPVGTSLSILLNAQAIYYSSLNIKNAWCTQKNKSWAQQRLRHYPIVSFRRSIVGLYNLSSTLYASYIQASQIINNFTASDLSSCRYLSNSVANSFYSTLNFNYASNTLFPELKNTALVMVIPSIAVELFVSLGFGVKILGVMYNSSLMVVNFGFKTAYLNITNSIYNLTSNVKPQLKIVEPQSELPVIESAPSEPIIEPQAKAEIKQNMATDNIMRHKLRRTPNGSFKPRPKQVNAQPTSTPIVSYSEPQKKKKRSIGKKLWQEVVEKPFRDVKKNVEKATKDTGHALKVGFKYGIHKPAVLAGRILDFMETEGNYYISKIPFIEHMSGNSRLSANASTGRNGGYNFSYQQSPGSPAVGLGVSNDGTFSVFVDNKAVMPICTPKAEFLDIKHRDLNFRSMTPKRDNPAIYENEISEIKAPVPNKLTTEPVHTSTAAPELQPSNPQKTNFLDLFRTKSKEQAELDRFNPAEQFSRNIEESSTDFWQERGSHIKREARLQLPMLEHINNNEALLASKENGYKKYLSFSDAGKMSSGVKSKTLVNSQQTDHIERIGNHNFSIGLTNVEFKEVRRAIESNQANPLLVKLINQTTRELNLASLNTDNIQLNVNLYSIRTNANLNISEKDMAQIYSSPEIRVGNLQIQIQKEYCDNKNRCLYYNINIDASLGMTTAGLSSANPTRIEMPKLPRPKLKVRVEIGRNNEQSMEVYPPIQLDNNTDFPSQSLRFLNGQ